MQQPPATTPPSQPENRYPDSLYLELAAFSSANLSEANLSSANLSDGNLTDANLSGAGPHRASLMLANLSGTAWLNSRVEEARFSRSLGLSEEWKLDLKQRGAIFEE